MQFELVEFRLIESSKMSRSRQIAEFFGPGSWPVRIVRPIREWALEIAYGQAGLLREVNGISLRVLPKHRSYFAADYDAPVAAYFRGRVRPGDVCASIGANLGMYPLQFAHWSSPGGMVYAFEPNPVTVVGLGRHIAMNKLNARVEIINSAVADRPGKAPFHYAGTDGMSRLGMPNPVLNIPTSAVDVDVVTLDGFFRDRGIRPSALMMDIEGFEVSALAGARELFMGGRPPIAVIEMHPAAWSVAGSTRADLERLLAEYRLRPIPLSGQTDVLGDYGHVALESRAIA